MRCLRSLFLKGLVFSSKVVVYVNEDLQHGSKFIPLLVKP